MQATRRSTGLKRKALTLAIGQCLAMSLASGAQAAQIFVADGAVDDNDDGICSIVEAVINANNDDQSGSTDCVAGSGTDTLLLPFDSVFTFEAPDGGSGRALPLISSDITFEGNNATLTRDAGAPAFGLAAINAATVRFNTLTLSSGTVSGGNGGCIYATGGRVYFSRATVRGCSASANGGAAYGNGTTIRLSNSTLFTENVAGQIGGGVYNVSGSVSLSSSTVADSRARYGGGIGVSSGYVRSYGTIRGNTASEAGGGIFATSTTVRHANNGVYENYAANGGGGFFISGGSLNLRNSRVADNRTPADGGGLRLDNLTFTLTNSTIAGNTAANGGGMHATDAVISGDRIEFSDNSASTLGGGAHTTGGSLTLNPVWVSGNSAGSAGGIFTQGGTIRLIDSSVTGNRANTSGGGVRVLGDASTALAVAEGSTFSGNVAGVEGGGLELVDDVSATLRNSTFGYNTATQTGGGLLAAQAALVAEHLTFNGNAAGDSGENLWIDASGGPVEIRNTLMGAGRDEGVDDCVVDSGSLTENLFNLSQDGTCEDNETGLIVEDPLLEPLARNGGTPTFALMPGSPAIDAADDGSCAATDQRDVPRNALTCDIGAFELTASIVVDEAGPGVGAVDINGADGLCSLPEALINSADNFQVFGGMGECEPGVNGAADRVLLPAGAVFTLIEPDVAEPSGGLPILDARTTIVGNGATVTRDSDREFRHLTNYGELTISNLTLTGGVAPNVGGARPLAVKQAGVADTVGKGFGPSFNYGGSILNRGDLALSQVTLSGNSAARAGGAIYSTAYGNDDRLLLLDSTLSNNTATSGGAISGSGDMTILNSTLSSNTATIGGQSDEIDPDADTNGGYYGTPSAAGGAIKHRYRGTLTLVNATLASNTAETGTGISFSTNLSMTNTIIADGRGETDCELFTPAVYYGNPVTPTIIVSESNLVEDGSCGATFTGSGQALLDPLANNGGPTQTHALIIADGNPAIDGGDDASCAQFEFDQRGAPFDRSVDGDDDNNAVCDIGAYESDGITPNDIIFRNDFE